ncbi:MAG TPA: Holliday junction resolvase RuvX [Patescibacteria group bacterium]|nr:Holliday junction resolvase RuvX [Patescibacteria group bacterium]
MSHYLAIDYGEKNIGIAITVDADNKIVPLTTLSAHSHDFWNGIDECIKENDIATIIVGLPLGMNGEETEQTRKARDFIQTIRARYALPVYEQDERLTSKLVDQLVSQPLRTQEPVDHFVAAQILETYLNRS